MISERTARIYEQHPPRPRDGGQVPTLIELLHEIEVAAKFGLPEDEVRRQLSVDPELFEALIGDSGISLH
jgi:hypothetical protein